MWDARVTPGWSTRDVPCRGHAKPSDCGVCPIRRAFIKLVGFEFRYRQAETLFYGKFYGKCVG
jgi:hypothetical protein